MSSTPNLRRLAQQGADLIIAHASGYNAAGPAIAQEPPERSPDLPRRSADVSGGCLLRGTHPGCACPLLLT